jgi:tetratricopeptide (TPR) repeat protein
VTASQVILVGALALTSLATPAAMSRAVAQDRDQEGARGPSTQDMLRMAYAFRRQGNLVQSAAAFERLLDRMSRRNPDKRAIAGELADLFRVMGRLDRALHLYRVNNDIPAEFDLLLELERYDEAAPLARAMRYARGEALALAYLGQIDEAIRILDAHPDLRVELARVFTLAERHAEAADIYLELEDFYEQARSLEAAGDARGANRAYDTARAEMEHSLRLDVIPNVRRVQALFEDAQGGLNRERFRHLLAKTYGQAGDVYERLATCYEKLERPGADRLYGNARRFVQMQRDRLLDREGGGDRFGEQAVDVLGVDSRIDRLTEKIQELSGG